jgi:hypothetical protein
MKLIRNESGNTAWEQGDLQMLVQRDRMFVLYGSVLNFEITESGVRLIVGTPKELQKALLSLTCEHNAIPLAGFTTGACT